MKSREREAYLPGSGNTEDSSNNGFGLGCFPLLFCPLSFFRSQSPPLSVSFGCPCVCLFGGKGLQPESRLTLAWKKTMMKVQWLAKVCSLLCIISLPLFVAFFSLISSVSLRRNRGTKVSLFSPLPPWLFSVWVSASFPQFFLGFFLLRFCGFFCLPPLSVSWIFFPTFCSSVLLGLYRARRVDNGRQAEGRPPLRRPLLKPTDDDYCCNVRRPLL